jgi:hypothetical protein
MEERRKEARSHRQSTTGTSSTELFPRAGPAGYRNFARRREGEKKGVVARSDYRNFVAQSQLVPLTDLETIPHAVEGVATIYHGGHRDDW